MVLPVVATPVAQAFSALRDQTINARSYCEQIVTATASGAVNADTVLRLMGAAQGLEAFATSLSSQTGFVASMAGYVQQQTGNATLDVTAAYAASLAALGALVKAIVTDLPKDNAGHLLDRTIDAAGAISSVSLSAAELPTVLPAITAWLATIS